MSRTAENRKYSEAARSRSCRALWVGKAFSVTLGEVGAKMGWRGEGGGVS